MFTRTILNVGLVSLLPPPPGMNDISKGPASKGVDPLSCPARSRDGGV